MKPYEIINNIIEDTLSNQLKDDYCLMYFCDHIRFDSNTFMQDGIISEAMLVDKHIVAGDNKTPSDFFSFNYFYHNNKWLYGKTLNYKLRKNTSKVFINHSWEPIFTEYDKPFWDHTINVFPTYTRTKDLDSIIVLHSEKNSKDLSILEKKHNMKNLYWFAHAYLCSEFYFKHYQKLKIVTDYKARPIIHRWLSANRLLRSHRTTLLELLDLSKGCYSLANPDPNGITYNGPVPSNSFDAHGNDSAEICVDRLTPWNTSFLHIVNETIWQDKIHFTEKIFKPIVMHQPFLVVQAPGSLKYLQSYGFKTFGDWWDESYDDIQDPTQRLQAIAKIINDIGSKDISELEKLRMEMAGVLEHNFHHFYENIPAIVIGELENNIRLLS